MLSKHPRMSPSKTRGAVDAARRALAEAESLAATTGAGPDPPLRRAIVRLHAAIE